MRHYCTLFDSKYLPQGLALYESLKRHSSEPLTLHVLPMDEECLNQLVRDRLSSISVTPLDAFEDWFDLVAVRKRRTFQEYCWTCASGFAWCVSCFGIDEVTYLDADTFFFGDPEQVFAEIGYRSIGIIPHRFPPHRKQMEVNGKFNVSWVTFRGPVGLECLETWARQCREKCSEKEGCGDQKYLDEWPEKFGSECAQIQNIGVGAAPWNLSQYNVTEEAGQVYLNGVPLAMYHFHELVPGKRLTNYPLRKTDIDLIYEPYLAALKTLQADTEVR